MEEKTKSPMMKAALIYGLIIGFVSIVVSVVLDLLGIKFESWANLLSIVISIGLIVYSQAAYKKEYMGGFASYGELMKMTLLMSLVSTILLTAYTAINITVIDPDALEKMYNMTYIKIAENPRFTDDMVDSIMERMEGRFTFNRVVLQSLIGGYIITVIIGLITAAFIKKEQEGPQTVA